MRDREPGEVGRSPIYLDPREKQLYIKSSELYIQFLFILFHFWSIIQSTFRSSNWYGIYPSLYRHLDSFSLLNIVPFRSISGALDNTQLRSSKIQPIRKK